MNDRKKISEEKYLRNGLDVEKEAIYCRAKLSKESAIYLDWLTKHGALLEVNYENELLATILHPFFIKFLPEEYIADLQAQQKRWQKQELSKKHIKIKTYLCLFFMNLGLIRCSIENIWLGSHQVNPEQLSIFDESQFEFINKINKIIEKVNAIAVVHHVMTERRFIREGNNSLISPEERCLQVSDRLDYFLK